MSPLAPGTRLQVASTKYGGGHHYRFVLEVVHDDGDHLVGWGPAGTRLDSYRGAFPATSHMLWLYWRDRDWNLEVNFHADWRPRSHYVNVATPASWDGGTLTFVDLDLDVILRADGRLILDDEDEFEEHRATLGYPPELVTRARDAAALVMGLAAEGAWPFDGSLYAWRPGDRDLPEPVAGRRG